VTDDGTSGRGAAATSDGRGPDAAAGSELVWPETAERFDGAAVPPVVTDPAAPGADAGPASVECGAAAAGEAGPDAARGCSVSRGAARVTPRSVSARRAGVPDAIGAPERPRGCDAP
jgi:hypothetical protein